MAISTCTCRFSVNICLDKTCGLSPPWLCPHSYRQVVMYALDTCNCSLINMVVSALRVIQRLLVGRLLLLFNGPSWGFC